MRVAVTEATSEREIQVELLKPVKLVHWVVTLRDSVEWLLLLLEGEALTYHLCSPAVWRRYVAPGLALCSDHVFTNKN